MEELVVWRRRNPGHVVSHSLEQGGRSDDVSSSVEFDDQCRACTHEAAPTPRRWTPGVLGDDGLVQRAVTSCLQLQRIFVCGYLPCRTAHAAAHRVVGENANDCRSEAGGIAQWHGQTVHAVANHVWNTADVGYPTTGTPHAIASRTVFGRLSWRDGMTKRSARVIHHGDKAVVVHRTKVQKRYGRVQRRGTCAQRHEVELLNAASSLSQRVCQNRKAFAQAGHRFGNKQHHSRVVRDAEDITNGFFLAWSIRVRDVEAVGNHLDRPIVEQAASGCLLGQPPTRCDDRQLRRDQPLGMPVSCVSRRRLRGRPGSCCRVADTRRSCW